VPVGALEALVVEVGVDILGDVRGDVRGDVVVAVVARDPFPCPFSDPSRPAMAVWPSGAGYGSSGGAASASCVPGLAVTASSRP
jgi:hypothetical protein